MDCGGQTTGCGEVGGELSDWRPWNFIWEPSPIHTNAEGIMPHSMDFRDC